MLKQILEDMYVDPELLQLLNEEQKENLFREMRKEQVKRWEEREKKLEIKERQNSTKKTPSKIGFHVAKDGKEWVWVLGEANGDLPYEELVRKHNRDKAAPKGGDNHVKYIQAIDGANRYSKMANSSPKGDRKEEVFIEEEWKQRESKAKLNERQRKNSFTRAAKNYIKIDDVLQTLPKETQSTITKRLGARRMSIQLSQKPTKKPPAKVDPKTYPAVDFVSPLSIRGTRPADKHLTKQWFKEIERPKGVGQEIDGSVSDWFHGIIDRGTAEDLLRKMNIGSYLVRVSDKIWGYVLSLKSEDGSIKHFRIDASFGTYQMVDHGLGGPVYSSLFDLILYYRQSGGGQILKDACKQSDPKNPDYDDLMDDIDGQSDYTTYL